MSSKRLQRRQTLKLNEILDALEAADDDILFPKAFSILPPEYANAEMTDEDSDDEDFVNIQNLPDSEDMYHDVVAQLCQSYGKEYPTHVKSKLYGCTDREICETVIKELKLSVSVEQLEKEMGDILAVKLPNVPLQPGAERLIKHLYDNKVPIAVATNSLARDVKVHLKHKADFFAKFHHMVTADDVASDRGKPHPDIYLEAASRFPDKPKPEKCLVFEDTGAGLTAGRAAGMQVVFIPYVASQRPFAKAATIVLKNLFEVRPEAFGLPPFTDGLVQIPSSSHKEQRK